jgi:hypothetical protein
MGPNVAQTDEQERSTPQTAAARSDVVSALSRVEEGQRDAMEDLRATLCAYVSALRQAGLSREAALAGVRTLIATPATPEGSLLLTPIVRQALAELTLQWCETEYKRLDHPE